MIISSPQRTLQFTTNVMKKTNLILCLLLTVTSISFAQNEDTELWTSVELNYKASKKWSFELREMIRFKEDISAVDQYYTQGSATYEFIDNFALALGYRFIRKNDNQGAWQGYENIGRIQSDLIYKFKTGRWSNGLRLRYQNRKNFTKTDQIQNAIRFKGGTSYNIRNWKLDPKLTYEYFIPDTGFNRYRITFGTDYKFSKTSRVYLYYSYERKLAGVDSDIINTIRLKYRFSLK